MNIEELAFKNIEELSQEDELILYDIIDFLQKDRKQWINQFSKTHNENVELQQKVNQLEEENKDAVFTKEETEKLLKQFQELDKCDTALTSSLMLRRKHLENELLKKKVNQLETNRDEAIEYINKIVFEDYAVMYDNGSTILEYEHDFKENLLEILERGKE